MQSGIDEIDGGGGGGADSVAGCLCSTTLYFLFIAVKEGIHDAGSRTFREKGRRRRYKKAQDCPIPPFPFTVESESRIRLKKKRKITLDKFFEQFSLPNFQIYFFIHLTLYT